MGARGRFARLRRCGWGLCAMDASFVVIARLHGPLLAYVQTVPVAELFAFRMALRYMGMQLNVHADCKPLVDVWTHGVGAGSSALDPIAHLWRAVWQRLLDLGVEPVQISHVMAHTPASAVAAGVITEWQRFGNARADESAKLVRRCTHMCQI